MKKKTGENGRMRKLKLFSVESFVNTTGSLKTFHGGRSLRPGRLINVTGVCAADACLGKLKELKERIRVETICQVGWRRGLGPPQREETHENA